jgi:hypothetical protein
MPDIVIFVVAVITFLLVSGGWIFKVVEVRRLGEQEEGQAAVHQAVGAHDAGRCQTFKSFARESV